MSFVKSARKAGLKDTVQYLNETETKGGNRRKRL